MKRILVLLAAAFVLASPALWADNGDSTNAPAGGPPPGHHGPPLTPEEMQELKAAHDAALQANPDLATQEKTLHQEMEAFQKQLDAAMITADPKVAPLIQKMQAAHKHHGDGDDDGPPPPPSGT